MKLKDLSKSVSDETKIWASKGIVRECDEEIKGQFVSYVDIGDSSFDVSINLSPKNDILNYTCDCQINGTICMHVLALGNFILSKAKIEHKIPRNRKISELEQKLKNIKAEDLYQWLSEILKKNKELAFEFNLRFSKTQVEEQTISMILDQSKIAFTSIVSKRKNIIATELKKIIDLWTIIQKPFISRILLNIEDKNTSIDLKKIFQFCEEHYFTFNIESTRIEGYVKRILIQLAKALLEIKDVYKLQTAIGLSLVGLNEPHQLRHEVVTLSQQLLKGSTEANSDSILDAISSYYQELFQNLTWGEAEFTTLIFNNLTTKDLKNKYLNRLRPIRFENGFNLELINHLVLSKNYSKAEEFAVKQIKINHYSEYDNAYQKILKEIYTKQGDFKKLNDLNSDLLTITYSFEDYLSIINPMTDEKSDFRNNIFARARAASKNNNFLALKFCYSLMHYEKKYDYLLKCILSDSPLYLLEPFIPALIRENLKSFMKHLALKFNKYSWMFPESEKLKDIQTFPRILQIFRSEVDQKELQKIKIEYKRFVNASPDSFIDYFRKNI